MVVTGLLQYGCTSKNKLNQLYVLQKKISRIIYHKGRCEDIDQYFLKSNVLSIYELYLKELIKYPLIYVKTSKLTGKHSGNNTFCFTRSNTAGKLKVLKSKNNAQKISSTDVWLFSIFC